jgi:CBS domain-containing protein
MNELYARDVMSSDVVVVSPETTIARVAKLLLEHHVSALPVVDSQGHLIGIVSEGDLLRRVEIGTEVEPIGSFYDSELVRQFIKSHGLFVDDVMTTKVASVLPNTPLIEIARLLQLMQLKRVPVIDHGKLVGIVSRTDLLRQLVTAVESSAPSAAQ